MSGGLKGTQWIWRDGCFIPWDDARIHVMSHVVHYGSSVFEGIRCYSTAEGPAVFRLREHLRRLERSAGIYRMEMRYSVDQLVTACLELVDRNGLEECYIRPLVMRGCGSVGVSGLGNAIQVYLICWEWGAYLGAEALEQGVDACVSSWQRPAPNTFPSQAKAGGHYANAQLIKMEAEANGYAEAIALNTMGMVSEGSGQNVFLVRDGQLITPLVDGAMLTGITRESVLELAADEGIPARQENVPRECLYTADELFFTGTAAEITPVCSVDRIPIGDGRPGPITKRLQRALLETVRGKRQERSHWLTYVRPHDPRSAAGRPSHGLVRTGSAA